MRKIFLALLLLGSLLLTGTLSAQSAPALKRTNKMWSAKKANTWYATQPWLVGCDFIPSTAVNELEMWQAATFDTATINKELGWAEGLGMNIVRVYLHNLAYEQDSTGFLQRMDVFLRIADRHHIKVMFVIFDSCWNDDPKPGPQAPPKTGVHNSGWLRAPGTAMLFDARTWNKLEAYEKGVIRRFATDPRVLLWDMFNEPSNSGYMDAVMPLLRKSFEWARQARPSQPITAAWWHDHPPSNEYMFRNSDVISFHNYRDPENLEKQIVQLQQTYKRPVICSEYMARKHKSTFQGCLPIFKKYKVGAINWGLVKGKTNTIYAWDDPMPGGEEPKLWFHDIFRPDGSVFSQEEVTFIKNITRK